jgi:hypothetical protein
MLGPAGAVTVLMESPTTTAVAVAPLGAHSDAPERQGLLISVPASTTAATAATTPTCDTWADAGSPGASGARRQVGHVLLEGLELPLPSIVLLLWRRHFLPMGPMRLVRRGLLALGPRVGQGLLEGLEPPRKVFAL